jgi:hypothetical protein
VAGKRPPRFGVGRFGEGNARGIASAEEKQLSRQPADSGRTEAEILGHGRHQLRLAACSVLLILPLHRACIQASSYVEKVLHQSSMLGLIRPCSYILGEAGRSSTA